MPEKQNLYRKAALERISSPDRLDKSIQIISPHSWLALLGAALIVLATVIWSVFGRIPVTVTAGGIVAAPISTNAVYTAYSGTVTATYIANGSALHLGTKVMDITTPNGEVYTVTSDQVGTVSDMTVSTGDVVTQNSELLRVSPISYSNQVIVAYLSVSDAKKLGRGMMVNVMPTAADSQSYGHMAARVTNIDAIAASNSGMSKVLGNDNNLSATLSGGNPVVAVTCELYPDADSANGYYWSNQKGESVTVSNGSLCTVKVMTEEVPPITKLFAKLAEIWGI